METELQAKLDAVCDEDSFVAFISSLAKDRAAKAPDWENVNLESFLKSAAAWATDWKSSPRYTPPTNSWKRCAEIIYAGKIYE